MFLRISKSANNPGLKVKLERNNQSILKGPAIFEGECICCFPGTNGLV